MSFTYILRCADDTLYVGHTEDLALREETHNEGRGAVYTATRRPVRMVYAEQHLSAASAIAREHQLKRWSREKKEALIRGDRNALDWLSHRSPKAVAPFTWRDLLNRRS
jgi:predicted GIY-YIG superfamily endonuclease